jgi:hypothetical protein
MASPDAQPPLKLQANLATDSYEGWAVERLMDRGWRNHDLCRTIVREWLVLKREELEREHGISRELWERERGGNVRYMATTRKSQKDGRQR